MSEEKQFLKAIDAQPDDRTVRLVYADWLEERGDARGELIRIEEEMATIPIHSDRYWELKPRRRELRKLAKRPWLTRMNYVSTDYEPVFADVPSGWKERWRLLREFTERWYGVPMDDVGAPLRKSESRYTAFDEKSHETTSPSLREWVAFLRDLEQIEKKIGDVCFGPGGGDIHEWLSDGESVGFLCWDGYRDVLSVGSPHLQEADPPVEYQFVGNEPVVAFPHMTNLALQYLLSGWKDKTVYDKYPIRVRRTKKLTQQLAAAFPVHSKWDDIEVFERKNMIAILNQNSVFTNNQLDLRLVVRKPASEEDVPGFVSEYPRSRDSVDFHCG